MYRPRNGREMDGKCKRMNKKTDTQKLSKPQQHWDLSELNPQRQSGDGSLTAKP